MEKTKTPPKEVTQRGTRQRTPVKRKRAGIELTREEVAAIKKGRKKLRKELRAAGIKSKKEFELTASSLMLYFDKPRLFAILPWLFSGKGLWALLGALAALLGVLLLMSTVTELRGHFTINVSDGMFREGFSLSENAAFDAPTMRLFAEPAVDVPAFSFTDIHEDVNDVDGQYQKAQYFAYTYYIRNEGESTVDYTWQLALNAESQDVSKALWVMVFEDDVMKFYAEPRADGTQEALPYFDDDSRGFLKTPLIEHAALPSEQYQLIRQSGGRYYYRLIPIAFESENVIISGTQTQVAPMDTHKYTIVVWLEGDDPDCTNDLIGGHAGLDMQFRLEGEKAENNTSFSSKWKSFWDDLLS